MNSHVYKTISERHQPPKKRLRNAFWAFVVGGTIALLGQGLIDLYVAWLGVSTKDATTYMLVTMIVLAALATGFGVFDMLAQIAGAGTFVPITGFSNAMTSSALESKSEGLIYGIGSNMFKLAGSVITYGVVSAYVLNILRFIWMKVMG